MTDPTFFSLVVGVFLMVFCLQSIFGFWRANVHILRFLGFILVLLALFLVVLGIMYLAVKDKFWRLVEKYLMIQVSAYHFERQSILWLMDSVQRNFQCCGSDSKLDWRNNQMYYCSAEDRTKPCMLPESCCDFSILSRAAAPESEPEGVTVYNATAPQALSAAEIPEKLLCGYIFWAIDEKNSTEKSLVHSKGCTEALREDWARWPSIYVLFVLVLWSGG